MQYFVEYSENEKVNKAFIKSLVVDGGQSVAGLLGKFIPKTPHPINLEYALYAIIFRVHCDR